MFSRYQEASCEQTRSLHFLHTIAGTLLLGWFLESPRLNVDQKLDRSCLLRLFQRFGAGNSHDCGHLAGWFHPLVSPRHSADKRHTGACSIHSRQKRIKSRLCPLDRALEAYPTEADGSLIPLKSEESGCLQRLISCARPVPPHPKS